MTVIQKTFLYHDVIIRYWFSGLCTDDLSEINCVRHRDRKQIMNIAADTVDRKSFSCTEWNNLPSYNGLSKYFRQHKHIVTLISAFLRGFLPTLYVQYHIQFVLIDLAQLQRLVASFHQSGPSGINIRCHHSKGKGWKRRQLPGWQLQFFTTIRQRVAHIYIRFYYSSVV